jgi:hypothetical protein
MLNLNIEYWELNIEYFFYSHNKLPDHFTASNSLIQLSANGFATSYTSLPAR